MELKSIRERLIKTPAWDLQQAWMDRPEKKFQAGRAWFGRNGENLIVFADFEDADVFTRATRFNEELYKLGDTLEIFIEKENRQSYLELHVAPNGLRSQLEWPSGAIERFRAGKEKIVDFVIADRDFFRAEIVRGNGSWKILAFIPLSSLTDSPTEKLPTLRVSISRYDYSSQGGEPVISSTSPHAVRDFHRCHEWRILNLNALES